MRLIGSVKAENSIMPGPGQMPPIPQPRPKQIAPTVSRQSMAFWGLKSYFPKYDTFLC